MKCEQLTQPASVTVQPGQHLTITCQVSYSVGSYYTAWIRQPAGKGLEWIGSKYTGGSYYKPSLKNKFSISLDSSSNTVTLNGVNVQPEDTAVYYCARDTQQRNHQESGTKTPSEHEHIITTGGAITPRIMSGDIVSCSLLPLILLYMSFLLFSLSCSCIYYILRNNILFLLTM